MTVKEKLVDWFPMLASLLIEWGNVGQLWRMWTTHTAAGQNPWSYVSILAALGLWLAYYKQRIGRTAAYWVTWVAIGVISFVLYTVLHFS